MSIFRLEHLLIKVSALLLLVSSSHIIAHGDKDIEGLGTSQAEKAGETCVRPISVMRRNHMELIKHQRDLTVRKGMRKTTDSIADCIACHVRYDDKHEPIPVNAEGQFCAECHEEVATELDCFECHSTVPRKKTASNQLIDAKTYSSHIENLNLEIKDMLSSLPDQKQEVKD